MQLIDCVVFRLVMGNCHSKLLAELDSHLEILLECTDDPQRAGLIFQVPFSPAPSLPALLCSISATWTSCWSAQTTPASRPYFPGERQRMSPVTALSCNSAIKDALGQDMLVACSNAPGQQATRPSDSPQH